MPTKREILDQLNRDELLAAIDRHQLEVPDRRSRDAVADALAASRRVDLADLLTGLSRDRLKETCRALGLDDGGREKTALIDRLMNRATLASPDAPAAKRTPGTRASSTPPEPVTIAEGAKLTTEQLERYLWSAADILRGSIDSSDYKNFIFGLLFLKRLSDRFDEECDALRAEGIDVEDKDEHEFFVPKRALVGDPQGRDRHRRGAEQSLRRARTRQRWSRRCPGRDRLQRRAQAR